MVLLTTKQRVFVVTQFTLIPNVTAKRKRFKMLKCKYNFIKFPVAGCIKK